MLKSLNVIACLIASFVMVQIATGEIRQELLERDGLIIAWAGAVIFAAGAFLNLRRPG